MSFAGFKMGFTGAHIAMPGAFRVRESSGHFGKICLPF